MTTVQKFIESIREANEKAWSASSDEEILGGTLATTIEAELDVFHESNGTEFSVAMQDFTPEQQAEIRQAVTDHITALYDERARSLIGASGAVVPDGLKDWLQCNSVSEESKTFRLQSLEERPNGEVWHRGQEDKYYVVTLHTLPEGEEVMTYAPWVGESNRPYETYIVNPNENLWEGEVEAFEGLQTYEEV